MLPSPGCESAVLACLPVGLRACVSACVSACVCHRMDQPASREGKRSWVHTYLGVLCSMGRTKDVPYANDTGIARYRVHMYTRHEHAPRRRGTWAAACNQEMGPAAGHYYGKCSRAYQASEVAVARSVQDGRFCQRASTAWLLAAAGCCCLAWRRGGSGGEGAQKEGDSTGLPVGGIRRVRDSSSAGSVARRRRPGTQEVPCRGSTGGRRTQRPVWVILCT